MSWRGAIVPSISATAPAYHPHTIFVDHPEAAQRSLSRANHDRPGRDIHDALLAVRCPSCHERAPLTAACAACCYGGIRAPLRPRHGLGVVPDAEYAPA